MISNAYLHFHKELFSLIAEMRLQSQRYHQPRLHQLMVEKEAAFQRITDLVPHREEALSNENLLEDQEEVVTKVQRKYRNSRSNGELKQMIGNEIECRC